LSQPRPELLFLAHRIPYPPNKGDKLRSYHALGLLAKHYDIHLGCFIDDPDDWAHVETVEAMTRSSFFAPLTPFSAKVRAALGLVTSSNPLSLYHFWSRPLQRWVDKTLEARPLGGIFVFSSPMAQYISPGSGMPTVVDFIDVDSEKWQQYSVEAAWPMRALYRREANTLRRFELDVARRTDRSFFVSEQECHLFLKDVPELAHKVSAVENGVDREYFCAQVGILSPYPEGTIAVVFTGAMDYLPNIDAACWFADEVFPALRAELGPAAVFYVVGLNPTPAVERLGEIPGVVVTGRVDDVRPYLQHARASVAPLKIARGVQNKVLEALSMETPVVATPSAVEGLHPEVGALVDVAESPEAFLAALRKVIAQSGRSNKAAPRLAIERYYDWNTNLGTIVNGFGRGAERSVQTGMAVGENR